MQIKRVIGCSLVALVFSIVLSQGVSAQNRDRHRGPQVAPEDTEQEIDRKKPSRRARPDERREEQGKRAPQSRAKPKDQRRRAEPEDNRRRQAQPRQERRRALPEKERWQVTQPQRREYDRKAERRWHKESPRTQRNIYVPRRWGHNSRPHHRDLRERRYSSVWWCGSGCRIALLFGFSVWAVDTVLSHDSTHGFPIWESLEYSPTGETSLWESSWGYVEFTPTRTFRRRLGRQTRDCRDFTRVVVRSNGRLERQYEGTACRNRRGAWWIVS
jgi:hypothetical protein